jgi:hypothetical protein
MCRKLVDISLFTVLMWLSRLYEAKTRSVNAVEGVKEGSVVVLKAKALEVSDRELALFEERLEKLI